MTIQAPSLPVELPTADQQYSPHAEVHTGTRTGEPIRVACACRIGSDHTFEQWLEEYAEERAQLRYPAQTAQTAQG